jgi:putative toxin-antitoxin system antitoxin component (TIGR02293 family)
LKAYGKQVLLMDKDRVIRVFYGTKTLPNEINSEVEMLNILNAGLPFESLAAIEDRGIVSDTELKTFIAARTLARRRSEKKPLSPEESDLIARIARIHDFAVEVFGTQDKAKKWLRSPNRALKGQLPLVLLRSD